MLHESANPKMVEVSEAQFFKAIGGPENIHPRAEPDASIWEIVGRREVVGKTVPGYKGGGLVKRQYFLIQPYAEQH